MATWTKQRQRRLAAAKPTLEFVGYDHLSGAPKWKLPGQKPGRFTQITAEDAAKRGLSIEQNIPTKEQWDAKAPERDAAQAALKAKAAEMFPLNSDAPLPKGGEPVETQIQKGPQEVLAQGKAVAEPALGEATAAPLPTDLPSLARLRVTSPELRPQIEAKIAELQSAAAPAAAALKQLPPVPVGHVRLFHGEGGPQGGGTGGAFYTSNISKASTFWP